MSKMKRIINRHGRNFMGVSLILLFSLIVIILLTVENSLQDSQIKATNQVDPIKATNQVDPIKTLAKHGYISIEDTIFSYDYVRGSLNTELLKSLAKISEDYPVVQMQPYSRE
jgi:hypothetical protein